MDTNVATRKSAKAHPRSTFRRFALVLLPVALAVLALSLIVASSASSKQSAAQPIILGYAGGFTGGMTAYDTPAYKGAVIAVEDLNKKGGVLGRPVKLISEDTQTDKVKAGAIAADLISKGATYIMTPGDFDFGSAAAIEAQKHHIVGMSYAGVIQFGVQGIGPYAYTIGMAGASWATAEAEFAYSKGWRSAYLFNQSDITIKRQECKAFEARWKELPGTSIIGQAQYQTTDPQVSSQVAALRTGTTQPDVIMLCGLAFGGITVLNAIRSAGLNQPILAGNGFDGTYWMKGAPKNLSNVYTNTNAAIVGKDPSPAVQALKEKVIKKYGAKTVGDGTFWVQGYSEVESFAVAAARCKCTSGPKMVAALDSFRNVPLTIGKTTFTKTVHQSLTRPVRIMQIQNGRLSFLKLWQPQHIPPVNTWANA